MFASSSAVHISNVIEHRNHIINPLQAFANLLKFVTDAGDWLIQNRDTIASLLQNLLIVTVFESFVLHTASLL